MSRHYQFMTNWSLDANIDEVFQIIDDVGSLPRWWPSVYLEVDVIDPGDSLGIGKTAKLFTKGWLPYTLRWQLVVVDKVPNEMIKINAMGDFDGRGIWTFDQSGSAVDVGFDWAIQADKPLLKYLSFAMKPLFAWNHRWAMQKGLESLKLEVARCSAPDEMRREEIPLPPTPTFRRRHKTS